MPAGHYCSVLITPSTGTQRASAAHTQDSWEWACALCTRLNVPGLTSVLWEALFVPCGVFLGYSRLFISLIYFSVGCFLWLSHFTSKLQLLLKSLCLTYSSGGYFSLQNPGFGLKSHILSKALFYTPMSSGMQFPWLMAQGRWPHNFSPAIGLVPRVCVLLPVSCDDVMMMILTTSLFRLAPLPVVCWGCSTLTYGSHIWTSSGFISKKVISTT